MGNKKKSLIFFWPSEKVGGAELLFGRIAEYMVTRFDHKVTVVDYKNGFIPKFLKDKNIPFNHIICPLKTKIELKAGDYIITADSMFYILKELFNLSNKVYILYWNIYPYGLLSYSLFFFLYRRLPESFSFILNKILEPINRRKIAAFIDAESKRNSYMFMDNKTYYYAKSYFPIKTPPHFLQLPIEQDDDTLYPLLYKVNTVRIGWLSRLEPNKVYALQYLIRNIKKYNEKHIQKCSLFIIGDGNSYDLVKEWCKNSDIPYFMLGSVKNEILKKTIVNNIDMMFAMGTSALEAASLKIPTVMLSANSYKIPKNQEYQYIWLYESINYSLALSTLDKHNLKKFDKLIQMFLQNKKEIGENCFKYCMTNHHINNVSFKFNSILNNMKLPENGHEQKISLVSQLKFKYLLRRKQPFL